jgi:hypothetical protein
VDEMKEKESNPDSEHDSKNNGRRRIIDAEPNDIATTTIFQPEEPTYPEEGEHVFHSHIWVKGTLFHFIVDNEAKKISSHHRSSNILDC